jgi:glycerol kinase
MLELFGIPAATLPRVVSSAGPQGTLSHPAWGGGPLPLYGLACDQQAALAGHAAFEPGAIKATYGTGVFVLATAGPQPPESGKALLATIAWQLVDGSTTYALDGGVFTAGALLDWLADELRLFEDAAASEALARGVPDDGGVRVLPALAGLGAPWWQPAARGVLAGLSRATQRGHLARAALDGIAHRVADVVDAIAAVRGRPSSLRVDGGLTANGYLLQRQADLLGIPLEVASASESTALGVAGLAGMGAGLIGPEVIAAANPSVRLVEPGLSDSERQLEREAWRAFVRRAAELAMPGGEEGRASTSTP